ncbi:MAG: RNA polymerase sigma factor [Planctomycetota bacterium]|jgi:RNA polymerase sigma-70 factor (ECF subfamily)
MRTPASDPELMVRAGQGDEEAYEELFRRHYGNLVAFFYRYRGERSWAEDLAQDVFLRLWKYRESYKPTGSFVGYMLTIARNVWVDKSTRRRPLAVEDEILDTHAGDDAGPEDGAGVAESRRRVRHALLQLPDALRAPLVLSRFHNCDYREIGRILDISPRTVESRVARATTALAKALAQQGALPAGAGEGDEALAWPPDGEVEEAEERE